jgi:hypothetical protein
MRERGSKGGKEREERGRGGGGGKTEGERLGETQTMGSVVEHLPPCTPVALGSIPSTGKRERGRKRERERGRKREREKERDRETPTERRLY